MERWAGKKWLFVAVPVVVLLIAVLALSRLDMGTSMVREKVLDAVSRQIGGKLDIERVKGNPLRGYRIEGIRFADGQGREVLSARNLGVSVSLPSLLGGAPSLKEMILEGAKVDVEGVMALLPGQEPAPDPEVRIRQFLEEGARLHSPVRRLVVRESTFVTNLGEVLVEEGSLGLAESEATADVGLVFRELPMSGRGTLQWDGEGIALDRFVLRPGTGEMKASGAVFPMVDVSGELKDIDLGELARLWPELAQRGFAGRFGTTFRAEGTWKEPTIGGRLDFQGGRLSGFTLDDAGSEWFYEGAKRSLRMKDVSARLIGIPVSGEMGFVFSQLPPDLDIDLNAADVSLDRVAERFPALRGARGAVEKVTVRLTGRTDAIRGNVLVRTGAIEAGGQKLGAGKAELIFDGSRQARFKADSTWLGRPLKGSGTFPLTPGKPVNMVLEAPGVPLEKLAQIRPEVEPLKLQGAAAVQLVFAGVPGEDLGLRGVISSERLRIKGELFQGTRAEVTTREGDLVIRSLNSVWNKARLGGSGVVRKLTSGNPELDLDATVKGLNLESLRVFAPGLAASDLKGTVSGSAKISGSLPSPGISFALSSPAVSAAGGIRAEELEGKGELTLEKKGKIPISGPFQIRAKAVDALGVKVDSPSLKGSVAADVLTIESLSASPGDGNLKASGELSLSGASAGIDLRGTFGDVGIDRMMPLDVLVPVKGKASGSFSVKGEIEDPGLSGEVSCPRLVVYGMALDDVKVPFTGKAGDLRVDPFSASVGGAPLTGKAHVRGSGASLDADFGIQGTGLDLASLTSGLKKSGELAAKGRMDLSLDGVFRDGKLSGEGEISSPSMEARGLTLTEVRLPVSVQEGKARLEGGSALFYGGKVDLSGESDLTRSSWKGNLNVVGADLKPVTTVLTKGKGSLTGKADLKVSGNGNMKVGSLMGSGNLSVGEGELGGFEGLDVLARLHGTATLGYRSILGNFTVDSSRLQLLPGTRVLAPQGDPMYRNLEADGPIGFDKSLDLNVSGNVNIQSLNALFGGIQGLLGTAGQSPEAMLQGVLGGLTGGLTTQDFRNVRFRLQGTTEKPRIKDLRIEQKIQPVQQESPAQDIQAAPEKQQPTKPEEVLQQKILEKIFGD